MKVETLLDAHQINDAEPIWILFGENDDFYWVEVVLPGTGARGKRSNFTSWDAAKAYWSLQIDLLSWS